MYLYDSKRGAARGCSSGGNERELLPSTYCFRTVSTGGERAEEQTGDHKWIDCVTGYIE